MTRQRRAPAETDEARAARERRQDARARYEAAIKAGRSNAELEDLYFAATAGYPSAVGQRP